MSILDILAKKGIIENKDIPELKKKADSLGLSLEEILVREGITEKEVLKSKGEYFGVPVKEIEESGISGKGAGGVYYLLQFLREQTQTRCE